MHQVLENPSHCVSVGWTPATKARYLYRAWRYRYRTEKREIAFLRKHLAPGQNCIDIGAHKGAFTYWMQATVGRNGRVFAFEPQPELADYLENAVRALAFAQVTVINAGLSSAAGTMQLFRPESSPSPSATFEQSNQYDDGETILAEVKTLDDFFETQPWRPIHFIKCDVEGHELNVFRGGETLLREDRPILLFESVVRHDPHGQKGQVFEFLSGLGYEGHFFCKEGIFPLSELRPEVHQNFDAKEYVYNFAFLPAERTPDASAR